MTLNDILKHNAKAQELQDELTEKEQITFLKSHKRSVFTFHMKDGSKLIRGDSESDQKEMRKFFKDYPQKGCERVEFHK